jgi:hypothetical protein
MTRKNGWLLGVVLPAMLLSLLWGSVAYAADRETGGYVGQAETRFQRNVWNFIKNFQTDRPIGGHTWKNAQYYWMEPWVFMGSHGSYVDAVDLAYVACHGGPWVLCCHDGIGDVDLRNAPGYGDLATNGDLEFLVIESCSTVIAFPDAGFDWQGWRWNGPGGVFRGLHQTMGFRTLSVSDNGVPNYFALRCLGNQIVWSAWFGAVQDERSHPVWSNGGNYPGWASAIMSYSCKDDRLGAYGPDPAVASPLYSVWEG